VWKLKRVGSVFNERKETVSDTEYPPLSVTKNGIVPQMEGVSKTDNNDNRKLVKRGDFVINSRSDRKGSSGFSDLDGSVSVINIVLNPIGIFPKYSHFLFKSYLFIEEFFKNGKGIVMDLWSTRFSELKYMLIPIPPLPEQQQIVSFLDTKTSLIDSLIEKTYRKIELLKEKRTSLINEVVTKGLNPNVEMKDSGVEWIGEIPSHWEIKPLYFVSEHSKEKNIDDEKTVLSLSYGNLKVRDVETNFGLLPESFDSYQRVRPNYLILRLTDLQNDKNSLRVGHSYLDGIITSVYVGLKTKGNMSSKYLYYHLHNSDTKKVLYSLGGGIRQSLRYEELKKFPVPYFSIDEQQQIVSYLDEHTQLIDKTISVEERRIELLKEYRQSLISEVVTGKRKVVD
jgi:type I restriction enzyme S subunit